MILSQNNEYNLIYNENIYGESPLSLALKSNDKIGNLLKEYENWLLTKKKSSGNFSQNKKCITTRNQKNSISKNEKNNHSKGVLYNNVYNLNTCHKKLNTYISKNNFNNSNNCSKNSNQNTSTLCDSSNNSIKKNNNHIYSMSSLQKEIIIKKKSNNQKNGFNIINNNLNHKNNSKELMNNSSFKGISNNKTATNTIGTVTNPNNSIMKSSISSSNKDSCILEEKIYNKKNLYKKCLNQKINKSNLLSKNTIKSSTKIIAAKKIMRREETKRIIIELNESDIKNNNKIQKIEIDLIDDSDLRSSTKSRNNNAKNS